MRSGVFWDEDTPVLAQNTQVQQWVQAALDLVTEGQLGQGRNDFLKALPKETEPGTKWRYNSGATQVLAWLTEKVYGKPFNEIISEKLWQPAGMAGDARMLTDRVGDAIASQGLYSRVFDLARFGELLRNDGRTPEGRQVVPAAWVRDMTTLLDAPKGAYGYQTWIGPMPGTFQASGFQGQKISVAPAHCLTGVRLSHSFGARHAPRRRPGREARVLRLRHRVSRQGVERDVPRRRRAPRRLRAPGRSASSVRRKAHDSPAPRRCAAGRFASASAASPSGLA